MEGTASLWMDGKIFRVEKRTGGSTALKLCLTKDLILFSNLREILPIQCNLRYTGRLLWPNFGGDRNRANLLENPLSTFEIQPISIHYHSLRIRFF